MSAIKVPRGVQTDILFNLLAVPGGTLTDDSDWTDGSTPQQWAIVTVKTRGATPTVVTSQFAKDIAADTLDAGAIKHPTTTTGIWRRALNGVGQQGRYAFRVIPSNSLAYGDYDLTVQYDANGQPFTETVLISLVTPGDVEFTEGSPYCTTEEVLANFELTILSDQQVQTARANSANMVHAYLQAESIATPYVGPTVYALKLASIAFARAELRRLIAGIAGAGLGVRRIKEADAEYEFISSDKLFQNLNAEGAMWMEKAIPAILGTVWMSVGTMGVPSYSQPTSYPGRLL